MNAWSDVPNGMRASALDEDTIERLLSARLAPDDAPPGYAEVARLVGVVAETDGPRDPGREERDIAAAIALTSEERAGTAPRGRSRTTRSLRGRVRIAGMVLAGTLVGSTGLAVAGALPDPAQDAFADVLDRVGIIVPAGDDAPESVGHPASTGAEISDVATSTEATGVDKGAEISSLASGGHSRAGQVGGPQGTGKPDDVPPVDTPNGGGTDTGDAAGAVGADRADERSDGRSAAGSSNAASVDRGTSAGSPSATPHP